MVTSMVTVTSTVRKLAAMLWAALWRGPRGKELRETLANSQRGTEPLGPLAHEKLNPANSNVSETGSGSCSSRALR